MVNVADLVKAVKKDAELELFRKIESICYSFGETVEKQDGKTKIEGNIDSEFSFGSSFYSDNQKMPVNVWAYDMKKDIFLSYVKYKGMIKPTRFSDTDFLNIPESVFMKIDDFYENNSK